MKRKRKSLILYLLIIMIGIQISAAGSGFFIHAAEEETEEGSLELSDVGQKPVDIVLSVGSSYLGLDNFEADLKKALEENHIDLGCVNIKTFDSVEISSESKDAYSIFTTWKSFPFNSAIYWHYDSTNKWLTTSYNEPYETGFIDQTGGYIKDFNMTANVQGPQTNQPLGFVFRVQPSVAYPGKWDMYYFWVSADTWTGGGNEKVFAIFKVEGQNLDASTRPNWSGTYSATPLMRYGGKWFGWPYHQPVDYGGYPHGTPYQAGVTVTNKADSNMKTKTIAIGSINAIASNSWYKLDLNVSGNHYTAKVNNEQVLDVVDSDNPYTEGYYGIFSYSHVNPKFKDILISQKRYKTLYQTLENTEWRENSTKIVINLNDKLEEAFSNEETRQQVLTKMQEKDIFYVGWGNDVNLEENEEFIQLNNGHGTTIDNTNYEEAITKIVNYVVNKSRFEDGSGTKEDPYIIRTKENLLAMQYYIDAYFRLEEDIDFSGYTWSGIGTQDAPFTGNFDGNGHVIKNLTIQNDGCTKTGFFGVVNGGHISNVVLSHVIVSGTDCTGALAGYAYGDSTYISGCYVEEGEITGDYYVGGLVGKMEGGTSTDSSTTVHIWGKYSTGGLYGLASGMLIKDCVSFSTITAISQAGGIIGCSVGNRVETCMSFATLTGNNKIGGLIGSHNGTKQELFCFEPIIKDCESFASVKGDTQTDGMVGYAENMEIEGCSDYSTVEKAG